MQAPKSWQLVGTGVFFLLWWVGCSAITVVPGSPADVMQRIGFITLPILAGLAFWSAWRRG
jgi:hypothetical protein